MGLKKADTWVIEVTSPGDSGHIREATDELGIVMKRRAGYRGADRRHPRPRSRGRSEPSAARQEPHGNRRQFQRGPSRPF